MAVDDIWNRMRAHLDELAANDLLRTERVVEAAEGLCLTVEGRQLVCLCTNDYLGLSRHPAVVEAARQALDVWGVGAGASRLVSGTTAMHVELERRLANFKNTPAALVSSTGWAANHVAIHALAGAGDMICCDKLNHASILDAAMSSGARVRTFGHRDVGRLESILQRHRGEHRHCLIVSDSLFSMDGDFAPLAELARLKKRFDAQLLIDEAHATGVFGHSGRGLAEHLGVEGEIDAVVGTLSKALGGLGGFVAGPTTLIDTIRNTGRPYIYTTAPPPAVCAAAIAALDVVAAEPDRRRHVLALADDLRTRLAADGWDTGQSASQIIPLMAGGAADALALSRRLLEAGLLVPAIRPPTVPRGQSRLRVSLSALHTAEHVDRLVETLGPR